LKAIKALSRLCYRARLLWFATAAVACIWFAVLLGLGVGNSARMLLPLSILLWALLGLCAGYWLAWMPAPVLKSESILRKLYKYMIIIIYIVLALLLLALGLGNMLLTFRAHVLGVF
jgi:hypothetical protein